jgi:hypothetical protein
MSLLALADVEANYIIVLAYQYTSITSVTLLDCATIPFAMAFSHLALGTRYKWYVVSRNGKPAWLTPEGRFSLDQQVPLDLNEVDYQKSSMNGCVQLYISTSRPSERSPTAYCAKRAYTHHHQARLAL